MVELAAYTSCRPIYLQLGGYHIPHPVWAIDSTGGYGAGLTWFLAARREQSAQAAV